MLTNQDYVCANNTKHVLDKEVAKIPMMANPHDLASKYQMSQNMSIWQCIQVALAIVGVQITW